MPYKFVSYTTITTLGHLDSEKYLSDKQEQLPVFGVDIVSFEAITENIDVGKIIYEEGKSTIALYAKEYDLKKLARQEQQAFVTYEGLPYDIVFLLDEQRALFFEEINFEQGTSKEQDCFIVRLQPTQSPLFFCTLLNTSHYKQKVAFLLESIPLLEKKKRLLALELSLPSLEGQKFLASLIQQAQSQAQQLKREAKQVIKKAEGEFERLLLENQLHFTL